MKIDINNYLQTKDSIDKSVLSKATLDQMNKADELIQFYGQDKTITGTIDKLFNLINIQLAKAGEKATKKQDDFIKEHIVVAKVPKHDFKKDQTEDKKPPAKPKVKLHAIPTNLNQFNKYLKNLKKEDQSIWHVTLDWPDHQIDRRFVRTVSAEQATFFKDSGGETKTLLKDAKRWKFTKDYVMYSSDNFKPFFYFYAEPTKAQLEAIIKKEGAKYADSFAKKLAENGLVHNTDLVSQGSFVKWATALEMHFVIQLLRLMGEREDVQKTTALELLRPLVDKHSKASSSKSKNAFKNDLPAAALKMLPAYQKEYLTELKNEGNPEYQAILEDVKKATSGMPSNPAAINDGDAYDHKVVAHYFTGGTDIFVIYIDKEGRVYSYTILNGDTQMSEFGYTMLEEITASSIELDFHWDKNTTVREALLKYYPSDFVHLKKKAGKKQATSEKASKTKAPRKSEKTPRSSEKLREDSEKLREDSEKTPRKPVKTASRKVSQKKGVKKPKQKQVRRFSDDYKLIKRFVSLLGKEKGYKAWSNFTKALDKSIAEKAVSNSNFSNALSHIQRKTAKVMDLFHKEKNPMAISVNISIEDKKLDAELRTMAKALSVFPSIKLLKRFISLSGKEITQKQVDGLKASINTAVKSKKLAKKDPYYNEVMQAKDVLCSWTSGEIIQPLSLGLNGLGELGCACEYFKD